MNKKVACFFILFFCSQLNAATFDVRLVINSGSFNLYGGSTIPGKSFSESLNYSQISDLFIWNNGDDVNLRVVNMDTEVHEFTIDNYATFGAIAAGDSVEQNVVFNTVGVFRYYDPMNSYFNQYLGLSGVIHIKDVTDTTPYFYWDIREHQENWNAQIVGGSNPLLIDYKPNYFTINGNSNPDINADPVARVTGNVNSEFKIVLINNGLSVHSMHFHGYHLSIVADSKNSNTIGRSKDTFPIYPREHLVLSCTPDKPGEYPVHDHNLVAVTGGQEYANGMFTTLLIDP